MVKKYKQNLLIVNLHQDGTLMSINNSITPRILAIIQYLYHPIHCVPITMALLIVIGIALVIRSVI